MSSEYRPTLPGSDGHTPDGSLPVQAPIHRAIDRLTVALLELQRIRHRIAAGTQQWERVTGEILVVEQALEDLGAILIEIRDT